jgi:hypothetical protein
MCPIFSLAVSYAVDRRSSPCGERARLEGEFIAARDRLRALGRLRKLTPPEEKKLEQDVAMAIARVKEHVAEHRCER